MEKKKNIVLVLLFIIIAVMACFGVKMSKEIFDLKQNNQQNDNNGKRNILNNQNNQSLNNNSKVNDGDTINDPDARIIKNVGYNNIDGWKYFFEELIISNNSLYAVLDDSNEFTKDLLNKTVNLNNRKAYYLLNNVKYAYIYPYGQGGAYFTYALTNDGNLYYIHNIKYDNDKYNTLELSKIDGLNNIITVESKNTGYGSEIIAINNIGNEFLLEYDNYNIIEKIN